MKTQTNTVGEIPSVKSCCCLSGSETYLFDKIEITTEDITMLSLLEVLPG